MTTMIEDPFDVACDVQMPSLTFALDPELVARRLTAKLQADGDQETKVDPVRIRVLRYKPGRRCVIEYQLAVNHPGRAAEGVTLIGKVRARRYGKSGYRRLKLIWDAGFQTSADDGICVPEPIGTIGMFRMWLQRKATGKIASDLWLETRAVQTAMRIVDAATKLHQSRVRPDSLHSVNKELQILHERLPVVGERHPRLTTRLANLLVACDRLGRQTRANPRQPIHRDFYADQVLVGEQRLTLLDFDLLCAGDPAVDIGNFIGHVIEQSLRQFGCPDRLNHIANSLEDRFLQQAGRSARQTLEIYVTLTLVRHIYLSTLFPERRSMTVALLELCEERMSTTHGAMPPVRSQSS